MMKKIAPYAYHVSLVQSTIATIGSLYLSDIAGYPPCMLCWYQRIAIYPLIAIFAVGIVRQDTNAWYYALPLVIIGWFISLYHNLLYFKILPESIKPCQAGVSCTTKYIEWFGFVTIPLLAIITLSIVMGALVVHYKYIVKPQETLK